MLADDLVKRGDESFKPIVTHEGELAVPEGSLPALTAFARTTDRTAALRAGFRAHLPKPLDIGELLAVIASVRR